MPIRVAVTGEDHGPELVKIIPLLGKDKVINRLKKSDKFNKVKSDEEKSIVT
ncbi:glutamyl-tRNA synthetase [Thermoanaerobacter ethanolicus JW 200]|nr:glutamyl-tRNA synthetase [Thermoanaerobacter ethanolicus JW 200]